MISSSTVGPRIHSVLINLGQIRKGGELLTDKPFEMTTRYLIEFINRFRNQVSSGELYLIEFVF